MERRREAPEKIVKRTHHQIKFKEKVIWCDAEKSFESNTCQTKIRSSQSNRFVSATDCFMEKPTFRRVVTIQTCVHGTLKIEKDEGVCVAHSE